LVDNFRDGYTVFLARFQSNFFLLKLTFQDSITKPKTNGHTILTGNSFGQRNSLLAAPAPGGKIIYIGATDSCEGQESEPVMMYENRKMTKLKRVNKTPIVIKRREYHTVLSNKTTAYAICGQTNDWPIIKLDFSSLEPRPLKLD